MNRFLPHFQHPFLNLGKTLLVVLLFFITVLQLTAVMHDNKCANSRLRHNNILKQKLDENAPQNCHFRSWHVSSITHEACRRSLVFGRPRQAML